MLRLTRNINGKALTKAVECIRFMSIQSNSSSFDQSRPNKERLIVRLCGQINKSPEKLENGKIIIPMITKNAHNDFYTKHRVFASSSKAHDNLDEGQRIYVTGVINYSPFQRAEGRPKQAGQIHSTNILICENSEDPTSDVNDVILFGYVKFKPEITENVTFLEVATQFFDRKEQANRQNVHIVLIRDNDELRQRANRMDIGDDVFIHGFLSSTYERNQEGQSRLVYRIRPRELIFCQKPANLVRNGRS